MVETSPSSSPRRTTAVIAACAAVVGLAVYVPAHPQALLPAFAIALLLAASIFDAFSGTLPLLLLLVALAAGTATTFLQHRVPWFALAALPFAFVSWKTHENAIGWGDVLALLIIACALPFWTAITGVIIGTSLSLAATLLQRQRAERMTPYLTLGAVIAMWAVH